MKTKFEGGLFCSAACFVAVYTITTGWQAFAQDKSAELHGAAGDYSILSMASQTIDRDALVNSPDSVFTRDAMQAQDEVYVEQAPYQQHQIAPGNIINVNNGGDGMASADVGRQSQSITKGKQNEAVTVLNRSVVCSSRRKSAGQSGQCRFRTI